MAGGCPILSRFFEEKCERVGYHEPKPYAVILRRVARVPGGNGCSTTMSGCPRCLAFGHLGDRHPYSGTTNGSNNNQMSASSQNLNQANGYAAAGSILD